MYKCFTFLLLTLVSTWLNAQSQGIDETIKGEIPFQTYLPKIYKANSQIIGIAQDKRGLIYVASGNASNIAEYDGANWRLIPFNSIDDDIAIGCLSKGDNGSIYIGGKGDFGVLKPNEIGELEFVSELEKLGIDSIGVVNQIHVSGNKRLIKTNNELVIIDKGVKTTLKSKTSFGQFFIVNEQVFVHQDQLGLFYLKKNELQKLSDDEIFFDKNIISIFIFNEKTVVVTEKNGIFSMSSSRVVEKVFEYNDIKVISSIVISDDNLSLGTASNGLIILDQNFNEKNYLGISKGLNDPTITCQYLDQDQILWCGTNNGVTRFEFNTAIIKYSKASGIKSTIEGIARFNEKLYLATLDGIYFMNNGGVFSKLKGIEDENYGLRVFKTKKKKTLLVAQLDAVFSVDKNQEVSKIEDGGPWDFKVSPNDSDVIIALHYNGLSKLRFNGEKLIPENELRTIGNGEIQNFIIEKNGTIWIGGEGVYKTHINKLTDKAIKIERFHKKEGLPTGPCYMFEVNGQIYAGTNEGIYKYDKKGFVVDNNFGIDFTKTKKGLHRVIVDSEDNIWMIMFDDKENWEYGYSQKIDGKYVWFNQKFIPHAKSVIHSIFHDKNGITWLGGPDGLLRYDSQAKVNYSNEFNSTIRKVSYGDSLLFNGAYNENGVLTIKQPENAIYQLAYFSNKSIEFNYAGTSFFDEKSTLYSYRLVGYDNNWSPWTSRTIKEYQLKEGTYKFEVKAKNIYQKESSVASYSLIILPPWYRTSLAYILYFLGFIGTIYLIIRLSLRRIKQQNLKLEEIVKFRTMEVVTQKAEVEKQRDLADRRNEEILDSINYAQRIQNAILPSNKVVKEILKESFIVYKPKDIIAGDFYWLEQKDGKTLFAAADCTGHGVPGAIVSVVCNNALNRSVREHNISEPGKILTKTREIVIEEFDKSDEEVYDGMDIALCSIEGKKLKYAGAHNPLWIVRKEEIIEIKADKQPIGRSDNLVPYTTHSIDLEKEDVLYVFSDGYVDQFGGPKGKKFKARAFRELLLSIQNKTMDEQKMIIDDTFENWRGDLEQIDDVCVIGVKI